MEQTLHYNGIDNMSIDLSVFNQLVAIECFFTGKCCLQIVDQMKNILYHLTFNSYPNLIIFLCRPINSDLMLITSEPFDKISEPFSEKNMPIYVALYGYAKINDVDVHNIKNKNDRKSKTRHEYETFSSKRKCQYICHKHDNTKTICEIYECSGD